MSVIFSASTPVIYLLTFYGAKFYTYRNYRLATPSVDFSVYPVRNVYLSRESILLG